MGHIHNVYDTNAHFKIDSATRAVKNTSETKYILVNHDHNSERYTFEIPRYIDGHDMSCCNAVQIHYLNVELSSKNKYAGVYEVDDLHVDPDYEDVVICSWLVSRNATQYVGSLGFTIRFACVSEGGNDYVWNTSVYSGIRVVDGIYNDHVITEEYIDIFEQWKRDLFSYVPVLKVTDTEEGVLVSITDKNDSSEVLIQDGIDGIDGINGKSAYELAVENNFNGSIEEWLNSLKYDHSEEFLKLSQQVRDDTLASSENAENAKKANEAAQLYSESASESANRANQSAYNSDLSADKSTNSAANAADSADKAGQHLINVNAAIDEFISNHTNKVKIFDDKLVEVNNTIDDKVKIVVENATDAQNSAIRAENATTGKLDKNQGFENAGKVLIVGQDGNVGYSNVYTQEEVDYMMADKMDKPYTNVTINENTTLEDCLDGNFKIDSIEGNTYQKIEENIVPTPDRPILIVSKKIVVGGETVELRSLKESANLFDYRVIKEKGLYTSSGSYISYAFKVKPNTNYYITKKAKIIPTETPDIFIGGDQNQPNGMYLFRDENVFKTTSQISTSGGYIYFKVNSSHWDNFVSNIDNVEITITESTSPPPSAYIAPTIRDYKIVDHVNKRSWTERNIAVAKFNNKNFNDYAENNYRIIFDFVDRKPLQKVGAPNVVCNIASPNKASLQLGDVLWETGNTYLYWYPNITAFGLSGTETKTDANAKLNEYLTTTPMLIQYELATPVIEEIPYIESDISEFGSSSQDTTSPSPNIKSEIEFVDKLEIKTTGANLLSNKLEHWYFRKMSAWGASSGTSVSKPNTFSNVGYSAVIEINGILPNTKYSFYNADTENLWVSRIIEMDTNYTGYENHRLYDAVETNNKKSYSFTTNPNTTKLYLQIRTCPATGNGASRDITEEDITNMQITLDLGEIKEHYVYQESSISHTLATPLVKCGGIADTIDLNNLERINNNYFGLLDLAKQNMQYSKLVANYLSYYWRANTMPKPKIVKNSIDKNNLTCERFIANLGCYTNSIGETISIYHDSSADFIATFDINRFKDVEEFKQFFVDNPTMVAYPLATPTVEPLEPELVEKLKQLKTYGPITHIFIVAKVKPTVNGRYPKDILLAQQTLETKVFNLQAEVLNNV